MKNAWVVMTVALIAAGAAAAAEVTILSYEDGKLDFTVTGSGAVTITAQIDFKYVSSKTGAESLARATSEPLKVKLTGEEQPVTLEFAPPDGGLLEVEIVIFVNGEEKARESLYY